ncbi:phospholipase A [Sphingomonas sp. 37zxx]|uniref:phospholipase A n=1 Tax=Sphingomonas sp. 37zxx TaxID=1550073 RepID=UPI00053BDFAB|nr:phospholipase A [Sphingomonas sp. 37zxx]
MRFAFATFALSCVAAPAAAQIRPVADQPASADAAQAGVDVLFVNDGTAAADPKPPETIEVTAADGTRLRLLRDTVPVPFVAAGGFTRLRYRPAPLDLAEAARPTTPQQDEIAASREDVVLGSAGTASGILDRFAPYRPVYGAFGTGDSGGKLQLSFAFQPFETNGALNGLRLAWTQTMFWRIDLPSGPVQSTNYSPEVFYEVPLAQDSVAAIGYAHDSNGRGPAGSIDVNRVYARIAHRFDLGDRWYAEVAPQAWFYVGARGRTRDLDRYWGYTSLAASIGQTDGVKLMLTGRGNPGTGKGAAELFASYPMARLGGGLGLYIFGQGFTGFGEVLDDYRQRDSHVRLGVALTR